MRFVAELLGQLLRIFSHGCFLSQRYEPPPPLQHTDLYFIVAHRPFSVALAHLASATHSLCQGLYVVDDLLQYPHCKCAAGVQMSHCCLFLTAVNAEEKTQKIDGIHKIKPTSHRNSKWSSESTCFDSSGRICAVCEPEPTTVSAAVSPFVCVPIHKSLFAGLTWITLASVDFQCFLKFISFLFICSLPKFFSLSKDVIILTAATPVGSYPTPCFFESSFTDNNWCLIPRKQNFNYVANLFTVGFGALDKFQLISIRQVCCE